MSIYLNNPWSPVKHTIFKDEQKAKIIHEKGYFIDTNLDEDILGNLSKLFEKHHDLKGKEGGMFYSLYSQDLNYRKQIFDSVNQLLFPYLSENFKDFKVVIYSFVVKLPGEKSEFYLHQDTTGVDETNFSPLSLWIPLHDVVVSNGCLGIIPNSHGFFSPYRSISFPAPFDAIQPTVKKYLTPLPMKKGEVLIFDNRILHNSYSNQSQTSRIAVICGLIPKEATFITCHKPTYECGGKVELIEHTDDYLLKGKNFLIDCQKRPETGRSLGWKEDPYNEITQDEFELLCHKNNIAPNSDYTTTNQECVMISEPILQEKKQLNFVTKLQQLFKRA